MKIAHAQQSCSRSSRPRLELSPYLSGVGIGVLSWVAFGIAHDPLGVTTAYSRVASLFALPVLGRQGVADNPYWKSMPFALDYSVVFLVGLMLGSFSSALFSHTLHLEVMHSNWRKRFGDSILKRFIAAFVGGAVLMYGARLAGGCTSGHAISGGLQLALSSWIFLLVIFGAGILSSALLFGWRKGVRA